MFAASGFFDHPHIRSPASLKRSVNLQLHHELCTGAGEHSWVVHGDVVNTLENTPTGFRVRPRGSMYLGKAKCRKRCSDEGNVQEIPDSGFRLLPDFAQRRGPVGIQQVMG